MQYISHNDSVLLLIVQRLKSIKFKLICKFFAALDAFNSTWFTLEYD